MSPSKETDSSANLIGPPWARRLVWAIVLIVMAVGFLGYLNPSLRLNWETVATMCGF